MNSKRVHLFEFEDQKWFPGFLRNYVTDFLQFLSNKVKVYEPVVAIIQLTIQKTNVNKIIDLGSGSGGGVLWLGKELQKKELGLKIILTDLYPNSAAFKHTAKQSEIFDYYTQPVDAKNVPGNLSGFRTMFLSFHHLKPKDARMVLQDAIESNQPIGIFEIQDRGIPSIIAMFLSPLSVFITTPFIRPFRFCRLIFTYLIPVVPLVVLWDGVVSCLRTYSVNEMKDLVETLINKERFIWEFNKKKSKTGFVIYTIGIPKPNVKE